MILLFYSVELTFHFSYSMLRGPDFSCFVRKATGNEKYSFDFSHSCIACVTDVCNRDKAVFVMYTARGRGRGLLFLYLHIFCTSPGSKTQGIYVDKYSSCIFTFI